MLVVYKYEIPMTDTFDLTIEEGARILHFEEQRGVLYIWVLVDLAAKDKEVRSFNMVHTGEFLNTTWCPGVEMGAIYVGTTLCKGDIQLHLFELGGSR